ncbi:MAG TPA: Uma2 family endonuclease [Gemmata sp.]|jgi:Uma2 family endonuclease|nr:Uma2 family endonuclease [Gemmata sp.]
MPNILQQPNHPTPPAAPRVYSTTTLAELLQRLGDISPERVRMDPLPGKATIDDLIQVNEQRLGPICEWIENTLVEKAMGQHESWVAFIIAGILYQYMKKHDLGMFLGPDGVMKILPDIGRAPDISFLSWNSLPGGKPPARSNKVPAVVPDLAIEVLSESNRPKEMERKRTDYFRAGVKRVWEIDPETRSAKVYRSLNDMTSIEANGSIDGEEILPGFVLSLREVFDCANRNS